MQSLTQTSANAHKIIFKSRVYVEEIALQFLQAQGKTVGMTAFVKQGIIGMEHCAFLTVLRFPIPTEIQVHIHVIASLITLGHRAHVS
jgi:hypothetical protein